MDYHSKYNHRWHSPKVKSSIEGLGVIAIDNIVKGEIVFVYGGVVIPKTEIKDYWKKMGHVGIQIDDDFFLCPTSREELAKQGVVNHSCEPNVGFKNSVVLVATRDIKSKEEIAFDYAFCESFMDSFTCNCGSKNCRKTFTPDDWKIKELQRKYGKYFLPYLKKSFEQLDEAEGERNPAIFLPLSLRFAKEYLEQLCAMRSNSENFREKELVVWRALWTALKVEIRKLFENSRFGNNSLITVAFFKKDPYKGVVDSIYKESIIQEIIKTANTFTVHLSKNKEDIISVAKICDSNFENLLNKLQEPMDAFEKSFHDNQTHDQDGSLNS